MLNFGGVHGKKPTINRSFGVGRLFNTVSDRNFPRRKSEEMWSIPKLLGLEVWIAESGFSDEKKTQSSA